MRYSLILLSLAAATFAAAPPTPARPLADPVKVLAGRAPLDVGRSGHSAPFFGDIDGDGLPDLLVGQFHEGRLRVYLNKGKKGAPAFESWTWFEAGGKAGRVTPG